MVSLVPFNLTTFELFKVVLLSFSGLKHKLNLKQFFQPLLTWNGSLPVFTTHQWQALIISVPIPVWHCTTVCWCHVPKNDFIEFKFWFSGSVHSFWIQILHLELHLLVWSLIKASKIFLVINHMSVHLNGFLRVYTVFPHFQAQACH